MVWASGRDNSLTSTFWKSFQGTQLGGDPEAGLEFTEGAASGLVTPRDPEINLESWLGKRMSGLFYLVCSYWVSGRRKLTEMLLGLIKEPKSLN